MTLQVGKRYILEGRPVKCVAAITRPTFVLEFRDGEPVYNDIFRHEVMAGQSNQFVVCEASPVVKELRE
jgi:hypothetical protein